MAEQTPIGASDGIIETQQVAPSTGPFAVDFPFKNLDDVIVVITPDGEASTTLVRGVGYALAATANGDGIYPSGVVTLTDAVANTRVTRYRDTTLERTSQIPKTGFLDRNSLNADLNRTMMAMQDLARRFGLFLRFPDEDGGSTVILPSAELRANMFLAFDGNGDAYVGTPANVDIVLGSYMTDEFLPSSTAAAARAALVVPGTADNNTWTGTNAFTQAAHFEDDVNFDAVVNVIDADPASNDGTSANTRWVRAVIAALAAGGNNQNTTVPTIVELTSGTALTWTVPAGTVWFDVEMVGGGGAGGGSGAGNAGAVTIFDGVEVAGGAGGVQINALDGVGTPGRGGAGGAGGTGAGTATKIIRKAGAPGDMGSFASLTVPSAYGGDGAPSLLGGSPGRGGSAGIGSAAQANSGAGGGGYGAADGNGGAGGGGAGEHALLRYATMAASYTYTVGAGGAGGASSAAGGTGYIRIKCHFNH